MVTSPVKQKILKANIVEHRKEAIFYDKIHSEIFNYYEQKRLSKNLKSILGEYGQNAAILEIGPGTGNITKKLIVAGYTNITAVDISSEMLEQLKLKSGLADKNLVCSDIDNFLSQNKQDFDLVIGSSVLHHLPDYESTLFKLVDVLANKGTMYMTHDPYTSATRTLIKRVLALLLRRVDLGLYYFRYLILIVFGKLKYLKRDCSFSDYHTGLKAIQ